MAEVRILLRWSVVTTVAMVSACGGVGDLVDQRGSERETAELAQTRIPPSVARRLEEAQDALRRDSTGRFVREITLRDRKGKGKSVAVHSTGRYEIERRRSRGTATRIDPSTEVRRVTFVSGDGRGFLRVRESRCWISVASDEIAQVIGMDPIPGHTALTGEVAGLLRADPAPFRSDDPEVFDVLVPLPIAMGLAGIRLDKREARQHAAIPVTAQVRLRSGRFASWSIDGDDILTGIDNFARTTDRRLRATLGRTRVRITLRGAGAAPSVRLPPRRDRVRIEPGDEFDPRGCETPIV